MTVVILARDEALHIARCIERIQPIATRIVVVDSGSTDGTCDIALSLGADVFEHPWTTYAEQFQWALDHTGIATDWVMRLDADEYCEPSLVEEIARRLQVLAPDVTGIRLRRKVIFRGRWIRFGGYYPTVLLRIWRPGAARIEQRFMDEHMVLERGSAVTLLHDLVDENLNDITWWTAKHNSYATRQMIDFIGQEHRLFQLDEGVAGAGAGQARIKRFLRNQIFARCPLYLRGTLYFLFRYFALLGFLDGRQGFVFHFLQGWWNWMLVDAKVDEARTFIRQHGIEAFRAHLALRHGYHL